MTLISKWQLLSFSLISKAELWQIDISWVSVQIPPDLTVRGGKIQTAHIKTAFGVLVKMSKMSPCAQWCFTGVNSFLKKILETHTHIYSKRASKWGKTRDPLVNITETRGSSGNGDKRGVWVLCVCVCVCVALLTDTVHLPCPSGRPGSYIPQIMEGYLRRAGAGLDPPGQIWVNSTRVLKAHRTEKAYVNHLNLAQRRSPSIQDGNQHNRSHAA